MLGVPGALIYGNHGMERLSRAGNIRVPEGWEAEERALRNATPELAALVKEFPGSQLEDKRFSLSLHYRGIDMTAFPELDARAREIAARWSLRLADGKRVMNVVPRNAVNKGDAVLEIVRESGAACPASSILFVGDDVTDEDAFAALSAFPNATTVRVGDDHADSAAKFVLDTPRQVHEMLGLLAAART
jgi:alpha,alpha-trehalase